MIILTLIVIIIFMILFALLSFKVFPDENLNKTKNYDLFYNELAKIVKEFYEEKNNIINFDNIDDSYIRNNIKELLIKKNYIKKTKFKKNHYKINFEGILYIHNQIRDRKNAQFGLIEYIIGCITFVIGLPIIKDIIKLLFD